MPRCRPQGDVFMSAPAPLVLHQSSRLIACLLSHLLAPEPRDQSPPDAVRLARANPCCERWWNPSTVATRFRRPLDLGAVEPAVCREMDAQPTVRYSPLREGGVAPTPCSATALIDPREGSPGGLRWPLDVLATSPGIGCPQKNQPRLSQQAHSARRVPVL